MAISTVDKFLEITDAARWSGSQSVQFNMTPEYKDGGNGGFAFFVVARSWAAVAAASSLYLVSGIQNGLYESCAQIIKETNGPTVQLSDGKLKITFANTNGGHYAFVPLYNVLA